MIVILNGYPGVGKLAIGEELIFQISGRLLDIHSVYNVAFALAEFKSPEFIEAVEKIESVAHDLILKLPPEIPVVLTTVLAGTSDWGMPSGNGLCASVRSEGRCWSCTSTAVLKRTSAASRRPDEPQKGSHATLKWQ
ncbi:hypothetical protein ACCS68_34965 [Rhizobium beringeri]|uniref:hypothetical protein n=1 Tax=Rhizobium beringeri TaxID=3019934 RepID=UPI003CF43013